ncbi:TetR/AcrR family transcriptional regulator [Acinetobacter sp. GXMZU3951]
MGNKSAKEKILDAAAVLFYNDGIANTGINAITERAGVAKMSLYNNFPTKSDLIATYIQARHQEWLDLYAKRLAHARTPFERILAVFDAYQDHAEYAYEKGFRGCGLLNAAAEFPAASPERMVVKQHKDEVEQIVLGHLGEMLQDQNKVQELALLISFVLEGSIARAGLEGNGNKVHAAKQMILRLLQQEMHT